MDFIDNSGKPPTDGDLHDAIQAVKSAFIDPLILTKVPPELAVNLPNILRCLNELKAIRTHLAEMPNVTRAPERK